MGGVGIRRGAVVVGTCCGAAAALFVSRHPTFNDAQQHPHATKRRPKPPDGVAIAGSGRPASAVAVRLVVSKSGNIIEQSELREIADSSGQPFMARWLCAHQDY
mmetsp:Transcript_29271/g.74227  ORF Transcript_29271/g.74227 Transcript_29271/m.74227 type:complete len:104 (-) Transcript_29271:114-425(-)